MKLRPIYSAARLSLPFATALVALFNLTAQRASAIDLYWDTNGASAGSGAATGTWGTDPFWSTDPAGLSATANTPTTGVDDLYFSAAGNGTGGIVTVDLSQTARKLTFEDGAITLSGGTLITLGGGGGINVDATAGDATVSTALTLNGNNIFNVGSGRTLTLDTGDFTRGTRTTLNIQGAGTVISTKAGLATGDMANGIVGPWASFGTGAATTYARFSGLDTIGGLLYTGSAEGELAAASTDVITGAGSLNYTLGVVGNLGASASINTLRYTGAAGTLATDTSFTTLGIMNSGTGLLTFSGAVTSGANTTEMVVNTANSGITFNGVLTGTITKTGSGTMTLSGTPAHSIGGITVNQGILITNTSSGDSLLSGGGAATINSGGTLIWGAGGKFANNALFTINAGGTFDTGGFDDLVGGITGSGTVTGTGGTLQLQGTQTFTGLISGGMGIQIRTNGDQTLSGSNTYTGTTTIANGGTAGTLRINSIADLSSASAIGAPTTAVNGRIRIGDGVATGTLVYTGTGHSTNRQIQIGVGTASGATGGSTIQSSGAGILEFTNAAFNSPQNTGTGTDGASTTRVLTLGGTNIGNNRIAGVIANNLQAETPIVAVVKEDAGTWILGGANTYTGNTNVSGGTLQVSGKLGNASNVYAGNLDIASGATFQYRGSVGQTLSGVVGTGGGNLSKAGDADLILSNAANAYGALNISAGRVFIGNTGALPTAATVALAGGTLDFNAAGTYNNAITMSSGANIAARKLTSLGNVTLPGSGSVIFNNDDSATVGLTITNNQAISGSLSIQVGGTNLTVGTATLSGDISGASGAITKTGTGTLTLSGLNTYSGDTTVSSGTLTLGQINASNEASTVSIASAAVLNLTFGGTDTVDKLFLNGVQQPGGVYGSGNSGGRITGTGTLTVSSGPAGGFSSWITGFGLAPADQDPTDDPENDGMNNLLEFVLNGNPSLSDTSILPTLVVTATDFEFTYQRRDDSVSPQTTQTFQWGTTLATWPGSAVIPATSGTVGVATITVSPGILNDAVTDTVKISIPKTEAGASGKLFGRLQVVK